MFCITFVHGGIKCIFLPNMSNKSRAVFSAWTIYSMHRIIVSSRAPTLHFLYNRVGQKLLFCELIQNSIWFRFCCCKFLGMVSQQQALNSVLAPPKQKEQSFIRNIYFYSMHQPRIFSERVKTKVVWDFGNLVWKIYILCYFPSLSINSINTMTTFVRIC